jgi:membrane associated rhomboid family serine protease
MDFLPTAPPDGYGYLTEHGRRSCTLEELREAVARGPEERVHFVWRPGTGRCVPAGEVPELFESLRQAQLARVREVLKTKAFWAMISGLGIYFFGERLLGLPFSWLVMLWGAFFVLPMADALVRRREWTRTTVAETPDLGEASRFMHWLAWRRPTKTTHVIIGALVITWLLSETAGLNRSVAAFGMDEAGVREGAWWKPLTCFFLHGGIVHLVFNALALSRLGQWVEGMTEAAWVPLILFLSTLGGSLAGYLLPPDVPSVGASGGVLGLLGFLMVFCRLPARRIPRAFQRQLWQWVGYVALLGLIGLKVIDNAAHLGGLLAGAGLGAVANATLPRTHPPVSATWVPLVGWPAAAVMAGTAAWMAWTFWMAGT